MTAAASMFFDTLDFAHRQIDTTGWHTRVANWVLRAGPLDMVLAYLLNRGAITYRRDAIKLKGVAANVAEARENCVPGGGDGSEHAIVIKSLEGLGERVLRLRETVLKGGYDSVRVQAAAKRFSAAAAELYETISNLRWEFLELEATLGQIGEGFSAESPEELDRIFARITHD